METQCQTEYFRVVASVEQGLRRVDKNGSKFDHLHRCQMFLPPQIFVKSWAHCGEQVVRVHDHVNCAVEEAEESAVTAWCEFDTPPDGCGHYSVMNHVQVGNLIIFLAQDEENGVEEFKEFTKPIPPRHMRCGHRFRIQRVVHWLASQIITEPPAVFQGLFSQFTYKKN